MSGNIDAKIAFEKSQSFNELLNSAIEDGKLVHVNAFKNAKDALWEEVGPFMDSNSETKLSKIVDESSQEELKHKYIQQISAGRLQAIENFKNSTTQNPNSPQENIKSAIQESKKVRDVALKNAKEALEDAFGINFETKLSEVKNKNQNLTGVTAEDLDDIIKEIEGEEGLTVGATIADLKSECTSSVDNMNKFGGNIDSLGQKSRVTEVKEILLNFKQKMANYPKHMSYEGSMVICVLLSMKNVASVCISNLPMVDQELICKLLPDKICNVAKGAIYFNVKFDAGYDFVLTFDVNDEKLELHMFNSVAHPRPEDFQRTMATDIPIEKDGEKISVGGKFTLNKKGIEKIIGVAPKKESFEEDEPYVKRPTVSGRNAYEIRSDVLQMAIGWSTREDIAKHYTRPEDVINLAKKFYSFVENKNR